MKKLIFLITILALFAINTQAQLVTVNMPRHTYSEVSTDYTITNAVAGWYLFNAARDYYTAQDVVIMLEDASGSHTNVAVQLQGRVSDNSAWANIGSAIDWTCVTADTTIVYTNTAENGYRSYKLLFTGTGTGVTTIDNVEFKQWLGMP